MRRVINYFTLTPTPCWQMILFSKGLDWRKLRIELSNLAVAINGGRLSAVLSVNSRSKTIVTLPVDSILKSGWQRHLDAMIRHSTLNKNEGIKWHTNWRQCLEKNRSFEKILYSYKHKGKRILKTRYYQISFARLRGEVTASCKCVFSFSTATLSAFSNKAKGVYCVVKSSFFDNKKNQREKCKGKM